MRSRQIRLHCALAAAAASALMTGSIAQAAPYASGLTNTGSLVSFVLNEPADSLFVSVNGGTPVALDGTTKGTKSFAVSSLSDTFSIMVAKTAATGYTIPTGGTVAVAANGLSQVSNAAGFNLISDDSSALNHFPNARGVDVVKDPTAPNFGQAYISNSTAASTTGVIRAVGRGLYSLKADGSDAYAYGNTAQGFALWTSAASANSPFRVSTGPDGSVYVTGFGDAASGVWRMSPNLTSVTQLFSGNTGPTALPAGQNHGSVSGAIVTGSYGSNLNVFTVDEDMAGNRFGTGPTTLNNVWQYNIGAGTTSTAAAPTRVNQAQAIIDIVTGDIDRGTDGKLYLNQFRSAGAEAGIMVLDITGAKIYDSLAASRALLNDNTAKDILRNIAGIAVSPDQKWIAGIEVGMDVVVIPLVNGLPDLANRLVIDTGTDLASAGKDIAFDAADNIHFVTGPAGGAGLYRVIAPGGTTYATTSWDGSSMAFVLAPEPASLSLLSLGTIGLLARRRKA